MNDTERYFIHLLSSHLNNSPPLPFDSEDWMGVFRLGELHNVTAMLTLSIKKLPVENRPPEKIFNLFKQALGMTLQSYESKAAGIKILEKTLSDKGIEHLYVKGAAIRKYYPSGEVRTSGDTDIIVDKDNLNFSADYLIEKGFSLSQRNDFQNVLFYLDEEYEIETELDGVNSESEKIFKPLFNTDKTVNTDDFTYELEPTYHLFYVISHLLRHLSFGGVGVRQLMDVDVLIRSGECDIERLLDIAESVKLKKSFMAVLTLAKQYFSTPFDIDYQLNPQLKSSLDEIILKGGVFGFAISDNSTPRMVRSINESKKSGFIASLKAFLSMIFVNKEYLYKTYKYARNHHILLPIAFFNRLFDAIFKRGKSNFKSVKGMFENNETALMISDIINELNIEL